MRKKLPLLVLLSLAAVLVIGVGRSFLPSHARQQITLPPLQVIRGMDESVPQVRMTARQDGLTQLPLLVTGRASAGGGNTFLQEWPGFHVEAQFSGPAVTVRFADAANRWRITLDQGRGGQIDLARPGSNDVQISGLGPGDHGIRVERISESSASSSFGGILIGAESTARPSPAPQPRLIEFIGDSDSVGFANGSQSRECSDDEIFASTDTSQSFGPQVARKLGADYRIVARSGIGLLRNYGGAVPNATMSSRYGMALPSEPGATRLAQRQADIVVTGIGSNDFGSDLTADEPWADKDALSTDFGPALITFLRGRVQENPDALQVLLAFGEYEDPLVTPYRLAEAALRADGTKVILVVLPKLQRTACLWHPSAQDHALIAQSLIHAIEGAGS